MKVILLQDIAGVGKKWEVKEVKGGYGRNYLLPANLAISATPSAVKGVALRQKQEEQKKALEDNLLFKTLESLSSSGFVIERKVSEKGHLFDGLDAKEIACLIKEKINVEIPAEHIKIGKTIKEAGKHKIIFEKGGKELSFEIEIRPLAADE